MKFFATIFFTVVTLLVTASASAQINSPNQTERDKINELRRKFTSAVKYENDSKIVDIANTIFDNKYESHLPSDFVGYFLYHSSFAYWHKENEQKALRSATRLTKLDSGGESDPFFNAAGYRLSFFMNRSLNNEEETYEALDKFLEISSNHADDEDVRSLAIEQQEIMIFLSELISNNPKEHHPLKIKGYSSIFKFGYTPIDPFRTLDVWRMDYARHLFQNGNNDLAIELLAEITTPLALTEVYIDKTFEEYWPSPNLDSVAKIRKAYEASATHLEGLTKKHTKNLQGRVWYIQVLVELGQFDKAMVSANQALEQTADFDGFDDREENLNWLLNELATISYIRGDLTAGNKYMERAAFRNEVGGANISHVINYTEKLLAQGEYQKAIEFQNKYMMIEKASTFGKMWVWFNEACIYHLLGDTEKSNTALQKLKKNSIQNNAAHTSALVCLNDLNGAAKSYIRRLNAVESRNEALLALQNYEPAPNQLPFEKLMRERWKKMKLNPELVETVNKYGRIETWPVTNTYWGVF